MQHAKLRGNDSRPALASEAARINYDAQGLTLRTFHRQRWKKPIRGVIGPLGSGKTQACISECLAMSDHAPARMGVDPYGRPARVRRSRGAVVRNTYRDLWSSTIKDWREWTDTLPIGHFSRGSNGEPPSWKAEYQKPDGTWVYVEVLFLAFDIEDDVRKIRGLQLSWVWCNECKELVQSNVNMLFGRTGRYPAKSVRNLIFDSNAPDREHWLGKIALNKNLKRWHVGIQPPGVLRKGTKWITNPDAENLHNLPAGYYADQCEGAKEAWIRQNLANEFVFFADGRPIHPDFNEQLHVGDLEATPGLDLILGFDFGRTPACTVWQPQMNGQWYGLMEIVSTNSSALPFGRHVRRVLNQFYHGYRISAWGDPAGDQMAQTRDETPLEMLAVPPPEGGGIECLATHTNDFEERITALDQKLVTLIDGQPAVMFDRSMTTTIKGMAGAYQFKRIQVSGKDIYQDKPDKGPESHAVESTHYAMLGGGEGVTMFDMADALDPDEWGNEGGQNWHMPDNVFE